MGFFDKPEVISPGSDPGRDAGRVAALEQRVARLEAQVAQLLAAPPSQPGAAQPAPWSTGEPEWMVEVRSLRARGKLIAAIKLYREQTGAGLAESKTAVEAM